MRIFSSTIGQKVIMAVTGLMMVGFVLGHMVGNLLIFAGQDALNAYAEFLQHGTHGLVWAVRGGLLAALALHIWSSVKLTRINSAARKTSYQHKLKVQKTSYAAITLRYGGFMLFCFIIYHLAHFTFGTGIEGFEKAEVYGNVIRGFTVPWVSGIYIIAMLALGMHLYHGVWSGLQTLGLNNPRYNALRKALSTLLAAAVVLGNCLIPIAVLTKLLELPS